MTIEQERHWDFVDEDGCLHCNCGRGVVAEGSIPLLADNARLKAQIREGNQRFEALIAGRTYELTLQLELAEMRADQYEAERDELRVEVKRLREVLDAIKEVAWQARALEENKLC